MRRTSLIMHNGINMISGIGYYESVDLNLGLRRLENLKKVANLYGSKEIQKEREARSKQIYTDHKRSVRRKKENWIDRKKGKRMILICSEGFEEPQASFRHGDKIDREEEDCRFGENLEKIRRRPK